MRNILSEKSTPKEIPGKYARVETFQFEQKLFNFNTAFGYGTGAEHDNHKAADAVDSTTCSSYDVYLCSVNLPTIPF